MSHLANLDTRYMVIVGVTVGLIALVCDMLLRTMAWARPSRSSSSGDKKGWARRTCSIILLIVVAIFAPLAAKAVQMAVSRQREYPCRRHVGAVHRAIPTAYLGAGQARRTRRRPFPE